MGYPGDQEQPESWGSPRQQPRAPYASTQEWSPSQQGEGSSYEGQFDSGQGGAYGADSGGYGSQYGQGEQEPYGSFDPGSSAPPGPSDSYGSYDAGGSGPYGEGPGGDVAYLGGDGGPGGYPGEDDDFPRRSPGGKRGVIIGAAIAAVVIVGGGGALAFTMTGNDKAASTPSSPPVAQSSTAAQTPSASPTPTGPANKTATRETDPKPLTLNEVFRHKKFKVGKHTYTMTVRRSDRKCSRGVHGTSFVKILTRGKCTQVLRATFTDGTFVGTIGVLNMHTAAGANVVAKAAQPKNNFLEALPAKSGSTRKIGQGFSVTSADTDGHFLILSWVQYPNGKKLSKKVFPATSTFVVNTRRGSNLGTALKYRSITGRPYGT